MTTHIVDQAVADLTAEVNQLAEELASALDDNDNMKQDLREAERDLLAAERDLDADRAPLAELRVGLEAVVDDLSRRIAHLAWVESDAAETPAETALRAIRDDLLGLLP